VLRTFDNFGLPVNSVCFSPNGPYAISGGMNGKINLWELKYAGTDWNSVRPYPFISKVQVAQDLFYAREKVRTILESAEDYKDKGMFQKAYNLIRKAQSIQGFERDKNLLSMVLACTNNGVGHRIGLHNVWLLRSNKNHNNKITSACISKDNHYGLSASKDNSPIIVWEIQSDKEVWSEKHVEIFSDVELYSDLDTPYRKHVFNMGISDKNVACFSPDGKYVLSGDIDGHILLYETYNGEKIKQLGKGAKGQIFAVAFSPDGNYAVSGGEDKFIRLWDIESGKELRRFKGQKGAVTSIEFSPDGQHIISGGDDSDIRLYRISKKRRIKLFQGHKSKITSLSFSPDGKYILSGSWDATIRIWSLISGKEERLFDGYGDKVTSVCFSPDGQYILLGGDDETIRLWDVLSGREINKIELYNKKISAVCFSHDGRYALSGSDDGIIKLWEFDWQWEFPAKG